MANRGPDAGRVTGQLGPPQRPVTLTVVARQVTYVDHAWLSSHFTIVARQLANRAGVTA